MCYSVDLSLQKIDWPSGRHKSSDLIDLFITKGINKNHLSIETSYDWSSDQSPVTILVHLFLNKRTNPPLSTTN